MAGCQDSNVIYSTLENHIFVIMCMITLSVNEVYVAMRIEKEFIANWQDFEIIFSDAPIPLLPIA